MSDRSPQSPMTKALVSALRDFDFDADFRSRLKAA
jgi:ABC-type antimicrobial peptide transport system ATPase subunit